ncbi:GNAT family N-acetyltransferase [Natronoglycomyces albus]|uniref:GNAT family N-acetyltransferase n=1 Tax=Natronoglycomyces albus TaxID=2811108 RepID=A0A895XWI7_9ACTN|nr:GNAT family N-acetyltransferase [Natronoglycomyces albus]QSB06590.1 GNAT family N-acetyltransferase [Natronoglycomyces albus]
MKLQPVDTTDGSQVDQLLDLLRVSHDVDQAGIPSLPDRVWRSRFERPRPGTAVDREAVWADERIVGCLTFARPMVDNMHLAFFDVVVHPDHRRHRIGSALLTRALELADEHRRTEMATVINSAKDCRFSEANQAAIHMLTNAGFTHSLREGHRYASVSHMDAQRVEDLLHRYRAKAHGYELLSWTGAIPREHMEPLLRLDRMLLTEVPTGDMHVEPERFDVERSIQRQRQRARAGIDIVHTVARHQTSGLYVGHSLFQVFPEPAIHAFQGITLVEAEHRGRGLGMLLKLANLQLLRKTYPRIELIETGTADENAGMNAINEHFGFSTWSTADHYLRRS